MISDWFLGSLSITDWLTETLVIGAALVMISCWETVVISDWLLGKIVISDWLLGTLLIINLFIGNIGN